MVNQKVLTKPTEILEYLSANFDSDKKDYEYRHGREIISALTYGYILKKHGIFKTTEQILNDEPFIGLLGQRNEFEMFSSISFLKLHAILHDAYGRVFNKYNVDRGYCYAFNAPKCLKKSPFLGHISGFWYCLHHKLF